ncbi:MAG: hypothetical protein EAZ95_06720 [Bacteroidetes bacterium]|nr:MAG: hypothetical protein EAZ95_06720 [Bacteroidota bacterium]
MATTMTCAVLVYITTKHWVLLQEIKLFFYVRPNSHKSLRFVLFARLVGKSKLLIKGGLKSWRAF